MKRIIFSASILFFLSAICSAQMRYSGQWAIHASGGPDLNNGFNIYLGSEKYFSSFNGSLSLGIDYSRNRKFVDIMDFHISHVSLSVLYSYSFEKLIKPPFFINIGGGIVAGTETFEKKDVPAGILQNYGTNLCWGLTLKPQYEILLGQKISLYLQPEIRYLFKSRFYNFIFNPSLGVKIYL